MVDQWTWYRAAIAGEKPDVSADQVQSGFFFTKASKAGGRVPVAIWRTADGAFKCRVGTVASPRMINEAEAAKKWVYVADNVSTRAAYLSAYETGTWPCGTPTAAPDVARAGSNLPTDPFERLQAEIADKMASAEAWMKAHPEAKTKTEADYATNLQRELNALMKQADEMHGAEKAPLLAATRAVDERFRFRDKIKGVGATLKSIFERFMVAQEHIARKAAQTKFEVEKRAAEIARAEAEKQFKKRLSDDPISALTEQAPDMPDIPIAPEPVKIQSGGGIGRAAGLKSVWVPVFTDRKACLAHYAEHPDVWAAIDKLARAETKLNKDATRIPGIEPKEERRAA